MRSARGRQAGRRRRHQQAHTEEQLRLQSAALAAAANGIVITDREGRIIWVNPAYTKLTGYTAEEAIGKNPRILKSGQHDQAFYRDLWETLLSGQVWRGVTVNRRKDGSLYVEDQTITPVRDERGEIGHFIAIKEDITQRKQAEEALRDSEARTRAIVESALDCIITIDHHGRITEFNPAAEQTFGCARDDVIGKELAEVVIPPALRERHRSGLARYLATGEGRVLGKRFEITAMRADGTEFPIELTITRIPVQGPPMFTGFVRDITQRKQAEEALRDSEERFRSAFEDATIGMALVGLDGRFLKVNRALCELAGYSEQEFLATNFQAFSHPDDLEADLGYARQALAGKISCYQVEKRYRHKLGHVVWVLKGVSLVRDGSGRPRYFIAQLQDITARKRAEEVRQALYQLARLLSRSLQLEEVYPAFADAVRALVPYDRICVIVPEEESLVTVLSVADPPLTNRQGHVWARRANTAVEWVMAHKTPRLVRDLAKEHAFVDEAFIAKEGVRTTLFLPLLVGGEAMGVFAVDSRTLGAYSERHVELLRLVSEQLALALQNTQLFVQVTRHAQELEQRVETRTWDLRMANAELEEAMRVAEAASSHKSEFLAHMSHELRTPLNSILGFSELLQDQTYGELSAKQARYVSHIHQSGQHLLSLINDLLDLSKVEAGRLELRPEPVALPEALAAALDEIRPLADQKRLTLTLRTEQALVTLHADPVRFKQILYNLLSNAVKFTPEAGQITVTAHAVRGSWCEVRGAEANHYPSPLAGEGEGEGVRSAGCEVRSAEFVEIAVADTGIGIQAEDLSRLFQPFTQLESTRAKQHQGTGLGLVLTKHLVELHGGSITAASAGSGQGSIFTVRLPLTGPLAPAGGEGYDERTPLSLEGAGGGVTRGRE